MTNQAFHMALATDDAETPERLARALAPLVRAELGPEAPTEPEVALVLAPSLALLRRFREQAGETEKELQVVHGLFGSVKGSQGSSNPVSAAVDHRGNEIARTISACWTDAAREARIKITTATVFLQLEYLTTHGDRTYRAEAALWDEPIYRRPGRIGDESLLKVYRQWLCLVASRDGTPNGLPLVVWQLLSGAPQARGLGRPPRLSGGTWRDYSYVATFPTLETDRSLALSRHFHPAHARVGLLSLRDRTPHGSARVAEENWLSLLSWRDASRLASRLSATPSDEWRAVLAEARRGVGP